MKNELYRNLRRIQNTEKKKIISRLKGRETFFFLQFCVLCIVIRRKKMLHIGHGQNYENNINANKKKGFLFIVDIKVCFFNN